MFVLYNITIRTILLNNWFCLCRCKTQNLSETQFPHVLRLLQIIRQEIRLKLCNCIRRGNYGWHSNSPHHQDWFGLGFTRGQVNGPLYRRRIPNVYEGSDHSCYDFSLFARLGPFSDFALPYLSSAFTFGLSSKWPYSSKLDIQDSLLLDFSNPSVSTNEFASDCGSGSVVWLW